MIYFQGFLRCHIALRRWKVGLGGPGRACLQEEQRKRQRPNQRQKQRRKGQGQGQEDPWLSIISIAAAVNGLSVSQFYGKCSSETQLLLRGASWRRWAGCMGLMHGMYHTNLPDTTRAAVFLFVKCFAEESRTTVKWVLEQEGLAILMPVKCPYQFGRSQLLIGACLLASIVTS